MCNAELVQRLYLIYAPRLFGETGVPAFPGEIAPRQAAGWRISRARRIAQDMLLVLDRREESWQAS